MDGRQRDLFPLPSSALDSFCDSSPVLAASSEFKSLSRSTQRRLQRRDRRHCVVREAISALNDLAGQSTAGPSPSKLPAGQAKVFAHLCASARDMGPPPEALDPAGAFEELRGASLYQEPDAKVAPYVHGSVSLPTAAMAPVALASLLGDGGRAFVRSSPVIMFSMKMRLAGTSTPVVL